MNEGLLEDVVSPLESLVATMQQSTQGHEGKVTPKPVNRARYATWMNEEVSKMASLVYDLILIGTILIMGYSLIASSSSDTVSRGWNLRTFQWGMQWRPYAQYGGAPQILGSL